MHGKNEKFASVLTVLLVAVSCFSSAMANDEQYLNSDPININGYVTEAPAPTDSELENVKSELRKQKGAIIINKEKKKKYNQLSKSTEKLSDVTEEMIEERKESKETIDKFNKKIDCLMAVGPKEGCEEFIKGSSRDEVKLVQAAPVIPAVVEAKVEEEDNFGDDIKILPYSGISTIMSGEDSLEAGFVSGVKLETNVNERFSIGIGFKYTSLKTEDYGNLGYIDSNYLGYYNSFYGAREIEYKNLNFDLYSKFFLSTKKKFRPYIGAGFGYNRSTLDYSNNTSANPNTQSCYSAYCDYSFGNEEVTSSSMNIELMLGSEINFTESFGANLEVNYTTGFGGNLSSENGISTFKAPDQQRLEDLSGELEEASVVSMFIGIIGKF